MSEAFAYHRSRMCGEPHPDSSSIVCKLYRGHGGAHRGWSDDGEDVWYTRCQRCGAKLLRDQDSDLCDDCFDGPEGDECPLRDDWQGWSDRERVDRLFESCPACGAPGFHVEFPE